MRCALCHINPVFIDGNLYVLYGFQVPTELTKSSIRKDGKEDLPDVI